MGKIYMEGIDISKHNGSIDLTPYKNGFVIIRAGYGKKTVDKKFARNADLCEKLGIPYGVYWYSYATSVADARTEAAKCMQTIRGRKISVGVWFDMEDADGYKAKRGAVNSTLISEMCKAFCSEVEAAGYYCGIYASASWFKTYIKGCDRYDKWVASWGKNDGKLNTNTSGMGSLQQYTSKPLDKNVMYVPLSTYDLSKPKEEPANGTGESEDTDMGNTTTTTPDTVNTVPAWAVKELQEAMDMGITDGTRPGAEATRCETAVMVKRGVEYAIKKFEKINKGAE